MIASLLLATLLTVPGASQPEQTSSYAVVVGNNASFGLQRRPLQYADDDAVRYAALFDTLMPKEHVLLLTELDRDTERLFPVWSSRANSPSLSALQASVGAIAERVAQDKRAGLKVSFYFVFAGHGDVDSGRGFLEMKDGPLTSDMLEELLHHVDADTAHVVLDSCNSFFVINPRKAGGRRFATPQDAAERLSKQLPKVGVFLSTSSESEVYEWSELQSGVFSHAVRSGLAGAADANGDGAVSYLELSAFVDTATHAVKNPQFRPKVFSRGPDGDNALPLVRLKNATRTLEAASDASLRLTVRDENGVRWFDVHQESGLPLKLVLPESGGAWTVDEGDDERSVRRMIPAVGTLALSALSSSAAPTQPRGPGDIYRVLFSTPFGPLAVADFQHRTAAEPEPVFGISREDGERMGLLLEQLGNSGRSDSRRLAGLAFGMAAGEVVAGGQAWNISRAGSIGLISGAALIAGIGVLQLVLKTRSEALAEEFLARRAALQTDPGQLIADIELKLIDINDSDRRTRRLRIATGIGFFVAGLALAILTDPIRNSDGSNPALYLTTLGGVTAAVGATVATDTIFSHSEVQTLIDLWHRDPALQKLPRIGVSALPGGGGYVVASGEF